MRVQDLLGLEHAAQLVVEDPPQGGGAGLRRFLLGQRGGVQPDQVVEAVALRPDLGQQVGLDQEVQQFGRVRRVRARVGRRGGGQAAAELHPGKSPSQRYSAAAGAGSSW